MRTLFVTCALLALASCHGHSQPTANQSSATAPEVPGKGIDRSHKGQTAPKATFEDPQGIKVSMAGFEHRPVLVNLWATWCAPCVKELPTLDRLARAHQDGSLAVVAISQDEAPEASVQAFFKAHNIKSLDAFHDPKMTWSGAVNAEVLPTSILFDANGREVWRYVGDQDWTTPEAAKLLAEGGVSPPK